MESREGFFKPEQEKQIKELVDLGGVSGMMLGVAIKLVDNLLLHRLKRKYLAEKPEALPIIYEFIDEVFEGLKGVGK